MSRYPLILCSVMLGLCSGCARFATVQVDIEYDGYGNKVREVRTTTKAGTLFDSKSKLTELKTTQDNAVQETAVGTLEQETTSDAVSKIAEGLMKGAIKGAIPTP